MSIFSTYARTAPSMVQQLVGRPPRENALAEISELLIEYEEDILSLPFEKFEQIARRHRVDMKRNFLDFRCDLFRRYLIFCYQDYHIDAAEIQELEYLRRVLYLSNRYYTDILTDVRETIYEQYSQKVVADGIITPRERQELARLRELLRLNHSVAERILHHTATGHYQAAVKQANADQRITDEEMKLLEIIASNLGLDRPYLDAATYELFQRYRNYWLIENGHLPRHPTRMRLRHGEVCHGTLTAKWYTRKDERPDFEPGGLTHRIRYAHAYVYNHQGLTPASVGERTHKYIETGRVLLTNQRLILTGHSSNRSVRFKHVLNIFPHSNGIEVLTTNQPNPFLLFDEDVDLVSMTLNHLLRG